MLACRWDSVKIVPTPGYHLTERPPEALQWRADAALQRPPEPLPAAQQDDSSADDEASACSSAGGSDIVHVAEAPPQRQSVASAASTAAGSGRSVRSAPPVDVLPIPAHADASPTLRCCICNDVL